MEKLREPVLLVGYRGMLGTELLKILQEQSIQTVAVDLKEMDITSRDSVNCAFEEFHPAVVLNASGFTDVDGCESQVETAFAVNAEGPANLAAASAKTGAFLIHVSTDYVFDGTRREPYREDDPLNPLGVYGKSKAAGEIRVREIIPENHCIVRTQWLFGLHGKNFVDTIIRLSGERDVLTIVDDQIGSPTYAPDLAEALVTLARMRGRGTFHVTNSGITSWYGFAAKIVEMAGRSTVIEPMKSSELQRPAPRPLYSVLDNTRFLSLCGYAPREWTAALQAYLKERKDGIQ
ncbi:dTDP-4-dehydrorhamnose reductase [Desulfomonile tiedjei]|uniref:dTDP-4-dehydrorhamnose reductase n=1 Tax=Desulfomonile tiedjei (strain ATCC 49306 / DSM 6799 / DCB-1) TaxID=706587 RepID=I4C138_DESTA|nr:dTDP-4-dehydrorhamnose reductase [Desulfomonile tiedjei]AFM23279.1 dTDP-4-dehydrorhamnose reductase [Desulfomonile tiedjei DSM 6799]